jgi:PadR family transcriptional regulator PadR
MGKPSDLVQGTLDLLILKTISLEPKHGWAIAKRIQQISGEVLQVQQGSLYPALHRLEQKVWIKAKLGVEHHAVGSTIVAAVADVVPARARRSTTE